MDTKISADFWSDHRVIDLDKDAKLALLWALTNGRVNMAGYAEFSQKLYRFETEADSEAFDRACQGLAKGIVRTPQGYWIKNFIKRQIGSGVALQKNKMVRPLIRQMRLMPPDVLTLVFEHYPELHAPWEEMDADDHTHSKGLVSPTQGHGMPQSREEQSKSKSRVRAEKEQSQGGAGGKPRKAAKAGAVLPADLGEPSAGRLLAVGALFGRRASTRWMANEVAAFRSAGLAELAAEDFTAQMEPLQAYYLADIPREKNFRRREPLTLLNNWAGEIDKARVWVRENERSSNPDGLKHL